MSKPYKKGDITVWSLVELTSDKIRRSGSGIWKDGIFYEEKSPGSTVFSNTVESSTIILQLKENERFCFSCNTYQIHKVLSLPADLIEEFQCPNCSLLTAKVNANFPSIR